MVLANLGAWGSPLVQNHGYEGPAWEVLQVMKDVSTKEQIDLIAHVGGLSGKVFNHKTQ